MRAVVQSAPGGPETLRWEDVDDPVAGADDVLIDVAAAGVNRADLLQREGHYPPPPGAPAILGLEVSGTVVQVGGGAGRVAPGDAVCALLSGGGYAERVAVPAAQVVRIPAGVDLVAAAAIPEAACTAWYNLHDLGALAPGETLLVHGASGAVGLMAVQVGVHLLGARVIALAGAAKADICVAAGAMAVVDRRDPGWAQRVRDIAPEGVSVVLDVGGAATLSGNLEVAAPDARIVVISTAGGRHADIDLGAVMARRIRITGSTLRPRSAAEKGAIMADVVARLWPGFSTGILATHLDRIVPMSRAADAHRVMAAGEHQGKIVLTPG